MKIFHKELKNFEDLIYCLNKISSNPLSLISLIRSLIKTKLAIKTQTVFLQKILNCDIKQISSIKKELEKDIPFYTLLTNNFKKINLKHYFVEYEWPISLYIIIRILKPELVVETGVFHGVSTAYILNALAKNNKGKLISIDLPPKLGGYPTFNPFKKEKLILPKNEKSGWVIPSYLKKDWELKKGKSKNILPRLFKKLKPDIFLHDSEHSYKNMFFEFKLAYESLNPGGLIFADNINWNDAFYDFAKKKNLHVYSYLAYFSDPKFKHPFGALKKEC